MKLVYENMGHILDFGRGYVNELVIENKKMFLEMVNQITLQAGGEKGRFVLSLADKPLEISKYVDITTVFAPFEVNRKSLLTKLQTRLESIALSVENYEKSLQLLSDLQKHVHTFADELPFEINLSRCSIGAVIRALSPEIELNYDSTLDNVFAYMETVRELDRDRLFIMVNMRTYFSDEDMNRFVESVCLHDFKLLLMENVSFGALGNVKRYVIDDDLCEF